MNTLERYSDTGFDLFVERNLKRSARSAKPAELAKERLLETAALSTDRVRPQRGRAKEMFLPDTAYKDIQHRMANHVLLHAAPLGFGFLNIRA